MRALLINPWIYDFAAYDLWSKPLGLLNIASYLKKAGCDVRLIDCLDRLDPRLKKFLKNKPPKTTTFGSGQYHSELIEKPDIFKSIPRHFKRYGMPEELFKDIIRKEPVPDIILVTSGMTFWYPAAFDIIDIVKKTFKDKPVILGGIYARLMPEHAKKFSKADFVYSGSSISEIFSVINKLTKHKLNYDDIKKDNLYPCYELYKHLGYLTLRTSSGCCFKCSYCAWYLLEQCFTQQDPDFVINQIKYFYDSYFIKNFSFYDEALLCNAPKHIIKILNGIIKKNIKANFHTPGGLHAKFMSPEIAVLLKKAGFIQPRLGFETVSRERQIESGAKTTNKDFLRAVENLKKAGFGSKEIGAYVLIGVPKQTIKEIKDTIDFLKSLRVRIFLEEYSPVPGTPYYDESGLAKDADPLMHNNSAMPLFRPDDFHKLQEIKDLVHKVNHKISNG